MSKIASSIFSFVMLPVCQTFSLLSSSKRAKLPSENCTRILSSQKNTSSMFLFSIFIDHFVSKRLSTTWQTARFPFSKPKTRPFLLSVRLLIVSTKIISSKIAPKGEMRRAVDFPFRFFFCTYKREPSLRLTKGKSSPSLTSRRKRKSPFIV